MKKKNKSNDHFSPPSAGLLNFLSKPFRAYFSPVIFGLENVDKERPALYVANHSVYGITDGVFFFTELYKQKNIYLRTLADNTHFDIPVWSALAKKFGMIRGSRENCAMLMDAGEHILVYPGGGRETFKHKGEKYKLLWKRRTGFAHMAIEHGYDIIPVASVGGDDAYDIIADSQDILHSWLGQYIMNSDLYETLKKGEYIPPISKGLLWSPLPKPVKIYSSFGKRISTKEFQNDHTDESEWEVRRLVELEMNRLMINLLEYRKQDEMSPLRKLLVRF